MHKLSPSATPTLMLYYATAATHLFDTFLTERINPRKKHSKIEKSIKRSWHSPHQSTKEMARRRRQLEAGIIRNYPGV